MESNAVTKALSAQLMRGRLDVTVDASQIDPGSLFGFAERRNPKRAFLFVSKVLGRHIPVRPSIMNASFHSLAAQIPEDLPGPVLVIGMAETAVGLGAGVHRAFSATRPDTVYMVSTRHPTGNELFARFEEEHINPRCADPNNLWSGRPFFEGHLVAAARFVQFNHGLGDVDGLWRRCRCRRRRGGCNVFNFDAIKPAESGKT